MNMKLLVFSIYFLSVANCNSLKSVQENKAANVDDPINFAISDFSKIRKLYRHDSVFSITIYSLPKNKDIIGVEIVGYNGKFLLTKNVQAGNKGTFPSKFFEKNGKLFFWRDKDFMLTNKALSIFQRYNLLQDDDNGKRQTPSSVIDESKRGVHYYFCKNDFSIYKRVITSIAFGYYEGPSVNCENR
jgi:hypothetical protein